MKLKIINFNNNSLNMLINDDEYNMLTLKVIGKNNQIYEQNIRTNNIECIEKLKLRKNMIIKLYLYYESKKLYSAKIQLREDIYQRNINIMTISKQIENFKSRIEEL